MKQHNLDNMLDEATSQLPHEITPNKDLWSGVEKALTHPQKTQGNVKNHWQRVTAVAACMCLGLLSYQVLFKQVESQYDAGLQAMTQVFQQEKQALLVKYNNQKALADNWQMQLVELEEAEQAIRTALKNDPENVALLKMLSQVYQQQLDLINKVHQPSWQKI